MDADSPIIKALNGDKLGGGYTFGDHNCLLAVRVALNTRSIGWRKATRQDTFDLTDKHHYPSNFQWRLLLYVDRMRVGY